MAESQLAYWSDFLRAPPAYCYFCEPIHLRADISDAIVFDHSHSNLNHAEALLLTNSINEYLKDGLYRLEMAAFNRWYLLSKKEMAVGMPTLREIMGRPIGRVLTDTTIPSEWRHLMNELQILLHQHPLNIEREHRGELPVNGVWIHVGSPVKLPGYTVRRVVTGSAVAQTICRALDLECTGELNESEFAGEEGDVLVLDENPATGMNRELRLQWMENQWFMPAYFWLRRKKVEEIIIDPADGRRFVMRRNYLKRFWKRLHTIDFYAKQPLP